MPNRLLPFSKTALLFSLAIAGLTPCLVTAQSEGTARVAAPSEQNIADAYVYLLGRVLVIRQEHTDLKEPGIHFNMIKYNPLGSADFVNPNLDVAYLEAWFAVDDKTPVILEVPKIEGRYYTAQILDEWGEVIANINERTFPSKPYGKFALLKPGSTGKTPKDAARIELHSSKAKMLARVELKGDPDGAVKLQKQFKVTAMGKPVIKPAPPLPAFSNKDLIGVAIFDDVDTKLNSALDVSPVAAAMQQKVRAVAAYVATGPEARNEVEQKIRSKVLPEFIEYAQSKAAPYVNNWLGGGDGHSSVGNYGAEYRVRTTANLSGIWANSPGEAIYFLGGRDAQGQPLNGSQSYIIDFAPGSLPEDVVNAYWSIILLSVPDYRVVPNAQKRYNLNNHSPLKKEANGGLKIAVGPQPVAGVAESNWLPSRAGEPFSLTLRTYVPKDIVLKGGWHPPAITPVNSPVK